MAFLILGDQLYSGGYEKTLNHDYLDHLLLNFPHVLICFDSCSAIGAVLIVIGLYLVLWGKTTETRSMIQDTQESLTKHLLQGNEDQDVGLDGNDIP